jgi:hypothetical protein
MWTDCLGVLGNIEGVRQVHYGNYETVFMFSESRESTTPQNVLREFGGALVSDFYTGYDSLTCVHQKCLLHLMRDINADLCKQPFNDETRQIATAFANLLRQIVESVDRFGLRSRQPHLRHWAKLTLFLRQQGAPLENNIAERALKKAILHRKNALFYKTMNGAQVGDLFMIHTCELNKVNPFDYLTELLRHPAELTVRPAEWMPWNYRDAAIAVAA